MHENSVSSKLIVMDMIYIQRPREYHHQSFQRGVINLKQRFFASIIEQYLMFLPTNQGNQYFLVLSFITISQG